MKIFNVAMECLVTKSLTTLQQQRLSELFSQKEKKVSLSYSKLILVLLKLRFSQKYGVSHWSYNGVTSNQLVILMLLSLLDLFSLKKGQHRTLPKRAPDKLSPSLRVLQLRKKFYFFLRDGLVCKSWILFLSKLAPGSENVSL